MNGSLHIDVVRQKSDWVKVLNSKVFLFGLGFCLLLLIGFRHAQVDGERIELNSLKSLTEKLMD